MDFVDVLKKNFLLAMLNYREKYGEDPLPSERDCENLKNEISTIVKKYHLGDKLNLNEYVYGT